MVVKSLARIKDLVVSVKHVLSFLQDAGIILNDSYAVSWNAKTVVSFFAGFEILFPYV